MECSVWIGFDPRPAETQAFAVARSSILKRVGQNVPIHGLILSHLEREKLYRRPTFRRDGKLWDGISDARMSTEFAISRFLVPHLAETGLALFVDADVMARADLMELFGCFDPAKACMVVKHDYTPRAETKMIGELQTA